MHLEYEYNDGRSLARIISDPIAIQLPGVEIDLDDEQVNACYASRMAHPARSRQALLLKGKGHGISAVALSILETLRYFRNFRR